MQTEKVEIKLSLFADDIIYVENPKELTKKLLDNDYIKIGGFKVHIQKSIAFLYTSNEQ